MEKRISLHHVGGRFGTRAFPIYPSFENDFINVFYEADPTCIEQIKRNNKDLKSSLYVFPFCLGERNKTVRFPITYDPYNSSFFKLNEEYAHFYWFYVANDALLSEVMRPMEEIKMDLLTLDGLYTNSKIAAPKPDFLSLDVEGYEYEVLQGSKDILKETVLGVVAEVTFSQLRQGQKLFGDVSRLLNDNGFYFVKFLDLHHGISPYRAPVGLRGEGFQIDADALFLKKIEGIDKDRHQKKAAKEWCNKLAKLAFISIVFNQFEYGLVCLKMLQEKDGDFLNANKQYLYVRFLHEINEAAKQVTPFYPIRFSSVYDSFEKSRDRFKPEIDQWGFIWTREFTTKLSAKVGFSLVEMILYNYGLREQAQLLKEDRFYHTCNALHSAGYLKIEEGVLKITVPGVTDLNQLVQVYINEQKGKY